MNERIKTLLTTYLDKSDDYQNGWLDATQGLPPIDEPKPDYKLGYLDSQEVSKWIFE